MKKKLLTLALTFSLAAAALTGCDDNNKGAEHNTIAVDPDVNTTDINTTDIDISTTTPEDVVAPLATPLTDGQTVSGTGYTIVFPSDWSDLNDGSQPSIDIIYGKLNTAGNFNTNINVLCDDNAISYSPDQYLEAMKQQFVGVADVNETSKTTVNGVDARTLTYSLTSGGMEIKGMQFYFKNAEHFFVVTFTDTAADFDINVETAKQIVASMTF